MITSQCINCDVCEAACPNGAIYMGAEIYHIDPQRCTECLGHFPEPRCRLLCPVDCIPLDPRHRETKAELRAKLRRLQQEPQDVS